ncbi:unnamed protein product [Amoebophrya sp. A120]|nr:unnamed protein product [Amoebophrya sp. A120]|eukprot:GSA120T00015617001.1
MDVEEERGCTSSASDLCGPFAELRSEQIASPRLPAPSLSRSSYIPVVASSNPTIQRRQWMWWDASKKNTTDGSKSRFAGVSDAVVDVSSSPPIIVSSSSASSSAAHRHFISSSSLYQVHKRIPNIATMQSEFDTPDCSEDDVDRKSVRLRQTEFRDTTDDTAMNENNFHKSSLLNLQHFDDDSEDENASVQLCDDDTVEEYSDESSGRTVEDDRCSWVEQR